MENNTDQIGVTRLTAEIVAAYVEHNPVPIHEVSIIIRTVAGALQMLGQEINPAAAEKPVPAVPVRRSVQPDHITCLLCGKKWKTLKRHLAVRHGLTPTDYRALFGLKSDYPMIAPSYSTYRTNLARQSGFGAPR